MVEETITLERWQAYEEEWEDVPFIDDMICHFIGAKKNASAAEVPMTREEYKRLYGR